MARPGITYQDVVTAAETLQAQQRVPTIENIRSILGTGSHSTIANHFRSWKTKQSESSSLISQELPDSLIAAMTGLWAQVSDEASSKIDNIQKQAELVTTQLCAKLSAVCDELKDLQNKYTHLDLEKESLLQQKLTSEQVITKLHQDIVHISTTNNGLLLQMKEKNQHLNELQRLNFQTQQNLEHYRDSSREQRLQEQERFDREQRYLQQTIKKLEQTISALMHEKENYIKEHNTMSQKIILLDAENRNKDALFQDLQNLTLKLQKDNDDKEKNCQQLQEQYMKASKLSSDQEKKLIIFQSDKNYLTEQLSQIKLDLAEVKTRNQILNLEKYEIIEEKIKLETQLEQINQPVSAKNIKV